MRRHRLDERPIRSPDRAPQRVAQHLLRDRRHDLLIPALQILQETLRADNGRLVGEFTCHVDGLPVRIAGAWTADRVESFEREAKRIDAGVTIGAGCVALVLCEPFADRQAVERLVIGGIVPASAGGGGVGVPRIRLKTQSPRLTGLVRNGADVVVSTDPSRRAPPRLKAFAPSTFSILSDSFRSFPTP